MTNPTLFGINGNNLMAGGEFGTGGEAIIPLNTLWKQLNSFADKIVQGVQQQQSYGNDKDININLLLDGRVVTATVVKNINNQTKTTGTSPLIIR